MSRVLGACCLVGGWIAIFFFIAAFAPGQGDMGFVDAFLRSVSGVIFSVLSLVAGVVRLRLGPRSQVVTAGLVVASAGFVGNLILMLMFLLL